MMWMSALSNDAYRAWRESDANLWPTAWRANQRRRSGERGWRTMGR